MGVQDDEEGWTIKDGRRYACCGPDGCPGMCPKFLVVARNRRRGTEPKCHECKAVYELPPGEGRGHRHNAQLKIRPKPQSSSVDKETQKILHDQCHSPPISAADRLQATRGRMFAMKASCSGEVASSS